MQVRTHQARRTSGAAAGHPRWLRDRDRHWHCPAIGADFSTQHHERMAQGPPDRGMRRTSVHRFGLGGGG